jgi:hypothetical protein
MAQMMKPWELVDIKSDEHDTRLTFKDETGSMHMVILWKGVKVGIDLKFDSDTRSTEGSTYTLTEWRDG